MASSRDSLKSFVASYCAPSVSLCSVQLAGSADFLIRIIVLVIVKYCNLSLDTIEFRNPVAKSVPHLLEQYAGFRMKVGKCPAQGFGHNCLKRRVEMKVNLVDYHCAVSLECCLGSQCMTVEKGASECQVYDYAE